MKTVKELVASIDPFRVATLGAIRRMAIAVTAKTLWQLVGVRLNGKDETLQAEVFGGIGIYARPPASGRPEAIVVMVGSDATAPAVIGIRDEKTRAAVAGAIAADETALYNSKAIVLVKADGTVEVRSATGAAVALATKDDLDVLRSAIASAVIGAGAGGAATINAAADALLTARVPPSGPWPNGTSTLKGE